MKCALVGTPISYDFLSIFFKRVSTSSSSFLVRDATLPMPVLILPSVQVNMRAGQLPPPEDNGTRYLKIPLDVL